MLDRGGERLFERLVAPHTLAAAFAAVQRAHGMAGPDGQGIDEFAAHLEQELAQLRRALVDGLFLPSPALRITRRADPGRPLVVPSVRDRVVQRALADVIGPRAEQVLHESSHAYRPGRSPHSVAAVLRAAIDGGQYQWVARADVAMFFDRIDRGRLVKAVAPVVPDVRVLAVIQKLLAAGVLDGARIVDTEVGIAQGSPLSPLLSNLYLDPFDRAMAELPETLMVRYCDDFSVLASDEASARDALQHAEAELAKLGLGLRHDKTWVGRVADGFEFVGFAFAPGHVAPPLRAIDALADRLAAADPPAQRRAWVGFSAFYGKAGAWGAQVAERLAARGETLASHAAGDLLRDAPDDPDEQSLTALQARDQARREAIRFGRSVDDASVAAFLAAFSGREACHAVERIDDRGQRRFVRRDGPLTEDIVRRHLSGRETVGAYCFRADGLVRWLCLDLDASRAAIGADGTVDLDALQAVHDDAVALATALAQLGAAPLLEDSGHKGRHVWVRFDRPLPGHLALRLAFAAEAMVGDTPATVRREHFPDRNTLKAGKDGPLVKLPLGLHGKSARRCVWIDPEGRPLVDPLAVLRNWPATPRALLEALPPEPSGTALGVSAPQAPKPLDLAAVPLCQRVLQGCGVLGHLAAKVESTRYLDHRERLLVAMTLGHLGGEGRAAVHALISATHNYNAAVTDRYLGGNPPSPISCGRIREKYPDMTRRVPCDCTFRLTQGSYPTPLLHALKPTQVEGFRPELRAAPRKTVAAPQPPPAAVALPRPKSSTAAASERSHPDWRPGKATVAARQQLVDTLAARVAAMAPVRASGPRVEPGPTAPRPEVVGDWPAGQRPTRATRDPSGAAQRPDQVGRPPGTVAAPTRPCPPGPDRTGRDAAAAEAQAVIERFATTRRAFGQARADLATLFGDRDRVPCAMGVLVRKPSGTGWKYAILIGGDDGGAP